MNELNNLADILSRYNTIDIQTLNKICNSNITSTCHIAVMNQPFLDNIIKGTKTIESRFTKVKCTPFQKVSTGDIIIFKEACGCILALSTVEKALYFRELNKNKTIELLEKYQKELTTSKEFCELKKNSKYASLFFINKTLTIDPIKLLKKDRRAWITFNNELCEELF